MPCSRRGVARRTMVIEGEMACKECERQGEAAREIRPLSDATVVSSDSPIVIIIMHKARFRLGTTWAPRSFIPQHAARFTPNSLWVIRDHVLCPKVDTSRAMRAANRVFLTMCHVEGRGLVMVDARCHAA
jgi:hypothetical protein